MSFARELDFAGKAHSYNTKIVFSHTMNRLKRFVQQIPLETGRKLLRRKHEGISIHPRLAGLGRQGFPGVSATFEAYKISRQGLDVGGLY